MVALLGFTTSAPVAGLFYAAPLLLTFGTTFASMLGLRNHARLLEERNTPRWLLVADLGILALALVLIATAPDLTTSNGHCKNLEDFHSNYVLIPGSAVVGGLAWGTASLQQDSSAGRLLGYAGIALTVPYAIFVVSVFATACTWN
jgi:hypothetical protein